MSTTKNITGAGTQISLVTRTAERFGVDPGKLLATLKSTAFRLDSGEITDEQMMALLIVAEQYGLNPFTKELYAFPDKRGGIVPVVSVDGWARIINGNPLLKALSFNYSAEMATPPGGKDCPTWCEVSILRKGRSEPTMIREWLDEVYREPFTRTGKDGKPYTVNGPWQSHTKRMLRHKTLIQGSRVVFGFAGIYDLDEAERILDAIDSETVTASRAKPQVAMPREITHQEVDIIPAALKPHETVMTTDAQQFVDDMTKAEAIQSNGH